MGQPSCFADTNYKGSAITQNLSIIVQHVLNKRIHFKLFYFLLIIVLYFLFYKTRDF